MKKNRIVNIIILVLMFLSLSVNFSCKKNDPEQNDSGTVEKIKKSAAFTAAVLNSAGSAMMDSATGLSVPVLSKINSAGLSYDPVTGWWTLNTTLTTGHTSELQFQFIDSHGDFRKFYSQLVVKINTKGTITGNSGELKFNIEITGFDDGDEDVNLNGGGTVTYQGSSGNFVINNVIVTGYSDFAVSGKLTVTIEGVSVTINYNGNSKLNVTFSYNGKSYSFTINLETGNIS